MIFDYPYTDMHELNLDWFLAKFKELVEEWNQLQGEWTSLHDYVQNYFDNLNVQTEIDNKINAMILDGSFATIVTPLVNAALPTIVDGKLPAVVASQISAVVAAQIDAVVAGQLPAVAAAAAAQEVGDWLAAHIDPDTGYVIDDTLTVSQAAADSKTVGDVFTLHNCAQVYSSNKDASYIEESPSDQKLYFKLYDMYLRPSPYVNKTYGGIMDIVNELGVSLTTSTRGVSGCILLENTKAFIFSKSAGILKIVDRNAVKHDDILILSQINGRVIYARTDLFYIQERDEYLKYQNVAQMYSSNHTYTLEESPDDSKVYFKFSELYLRPSPYINKTYNDINSFATEIGASLVTSPSGVTNCIALESAKTLVYDILDKVCKIIDRQNVKATDIVILSQVLGRVVYAREDVFPPARNLGDLSSKINTGNMNCYISNSRMIDSTRFNSDLNILFFTDIHGSDANMKRIVKFANALGSSKLDVIINGGDTVTSKISDGLTWYDDNVDDCDIDTLICVGNHDEWADPQTQTEADMDDVYAAEIAPMVDKVTGIVQPADAETDALCYYYKDYGDIRIIVLDAMEGHITSHHYDNAQDTWFRSVLADAITNSKHVICVNHAPYEYNDANLQSLDAGGWNCFKPYNTGADAVHIATGALSAIQDFVSNNGEFICWLTGHRHEDFVVTDTVYDQTMIITSTAKNSAHTIEGAVTSDITNPLYDCFDYIGIDTTNNIIKLWRIGYNLDGGLKHKNTLSFNYKTNAVIYAE